LWCADQFRRRRKNRAIRPKLQTPIEGENQMGIRDNYAYGKSQYLKAGDLIGKTVNVTVEAAEDTEFEKGLKPVLSFVGKEKKLVVNATNFDTLSDAFGGYTEAWIGKSITLAGEKITVKGVRTDTIKVRIPPQQKQQVPTTTAVDDDAEAPF
jgi:flagellar hook assembly protein FlgD